MKVFAVLLCTLVVAFGATVEHPIENHHLAKLANGFESILLENLGEYLRLQVEMIEGVQKIQLLLGNVEKILESEFTGNTHTKNVGATIPEEKNEDPIVSLEHGFENTLLDYLGAYQELQIRLNTGIEKIQLALGNVETILKEAFTHDSLTEIESEKLTKRNKAKDSAKQQKNGK